MVTEYKQVHSMHMIVLYENVLQISYSREIISVG